jgi:signal transduction histidine kinase/CheY-like chemotaxis protein
MTTVKRDQIINELRSRIKLLEKQQNNSGNYLQEKLLLMLVSESIQKADSPDELLIQILERISVLLDLPFSAFCELAEVQIKTIEVFDLKGIERSDSPVFEFDSKIVLKLKKGPLILGKDDDDFSGILFRKDSGKSLQAAAMFPFQSLYIPFGVFVLFGGAGMEDQFASISSTIQQLIIFTVEKLEKLKLSQELKELNHSFDKELERRIEQLQTDYDKLNIQYGELQKSSQRPFRKESLMPKEEAALLQSFLKSIGVEIRTPLNGMMGFAELIRENDLRPDDKNKYIDIIKSCGKSLVKIVDDALEFAIIKSGKIELNKSEFVLAPFMTDLYDHYKKDELFRQREKLELRINLNIVGTTRINADREKLMLIMTNLIGNSIKFTDSGYIEFGCSIQKPKRPKSKEQDILFFVKDTGIGIAAEHSDKIFHEFYKVEHEISKLYGGLGLGLTLAKILVEMMGGEIWFTTGMEKGTSFFFTIPGALILSDADLEVLDENGMDNYPVWNEKRILIVEDDSMSVIYLKEALKSTGVQIMHAGDGKSAVELVSSGIPIDLILMDIKLPGMSGYEATKRIKAITNIPIIAQTAYAMADDYKKILQVGCDDYVSKPINRRKLLKKINDIFLKGLLSSEF